VFRARAGYFPKVAYREVIGGVRAHVQLPYAEVNAVGTCLNCGGEAFARAHRSHYFVFFSLHDAKILNFFQYLIIYSNREKYKGKGE
jgi:hypothetical protein